MKKKTVFIVISAILALIIFFILLSFALQITMKNSGAYKCTIEFIKTNTDVVDECGTYISTDSLISGFLNQRIVSKNAQGNAELMFDFKAQKGTFKINAVLEKDNGKWVMQKFRIWDNSENQKNTWDGSVE